LYSDGHKLAGHMSNPFSLENKNILITGAASGIGRQCALSSEALGASLILFDQNEEGLNETLELLKHKSFHFISVVDLTDVEATSRSLSTAVEKAGRINGVLHCAGISTTLPLKLATPELVDKFFRVNVYTSYFLTREVCKVNNLAKEGASIVFFSSVVGSFGGKRKITIWYDQGGIGRCGQIPCCGTGQKEGSGKRGFSRSHHYPH
ncbi:MAG TPA: SDR family NAD(P)-dependent oxidoreductase, partial [Prolixibacteraceae bacterium]|nr:SDR family NAD(P)-dependent oxidoreductase [Prolixibacteraceae bacterium]